MEIETINCVYVAKKSEILAFFCDIYFHELKFERLVDTGGKEMKVQTRS